MENANQKLVSTTSILQNSFEDLERDLEKKESLDRNQEEKESNSENPEGKIVVEPIKTLFNFPSPVIGFTMIYLISLNF